MNIKRCSLVATLLLFSPLSLGKDVYKCMVNGKPVYQEHKCDDQSKPVHIKDVAAPMKGIDAKEKVKNAAEHMDKKYKDRINVHQKRIEKYRKKMAKELKALDKNTDDALEKISIADQKYAIVVHYRTQIETEEFLIAEILQEMQLEKTRRLEEENE